MPNLTLPLLSTFFLLAQEEAAEAAEEVASGSGFEFVALLNQALNGIGIVGILLLTGLGLAITFGVMRIINLAHGEFIMLGAYVTFLMQDLFNMDLLMTSPFAFAGTAIVGASVELTIIRRL